MKNIFDSCNIKNIEELLCEFSCYILGRYRAGHKKEKLYKRILSHLATTFIYIGFFVCMSGVTLLEFIMCVVDAVRLIVTDLYNRHYAQVVQSPRVDLAYQIREILCEILQKNATVLGVLAPDTVSDITPTQYSVYASVNGLDYLQFIVSYVEDISDLTKKRDFLNQKISQYAQENLYALPFFYNDLCAFTVYDVDKDLYHQNCLCIKVMIIDSQDKYNFVVQHLASKPSVALKQVNDMEF